MFLTTHATVGILLARFIPNPFFAFLAGFASHYLLDIIPHDRMIQDPVTASKVKAGELDFKKLPEFKSFAIYAIIDFIIMAIGLGIIFYYRPGENPEIAFWAIMGTILPDFLWLPYTAWKIKLFKPFHLINQKAHSLIPDVIPTWLGTACQAILVSVILYLSYFR